MNEIPAAPDEFIRAYHLTSAQHALADIGLQRLKVARIDDVNDPFELQAMNCMRKDVRKAVANFRAAQTEKIGLLCFSQAWRNPVLWSHYADRHRGICLGFDVEKGLGIRGVEAVKYEIDKLKLNEHQRFEQMSEDEQQLLFITKFHHWAYEEELRVTVKLSEAVKESGLYFFPFSERLRLRKVVLGPLCPTSLLEPIRKLVRATHAGAVVSKARLGFKYFEVKEDGRYPPR